MPKPTFLNLSAEKRNNFLKIASREFADRDYSAASVSKIVEKAGIAKGSVYQYFEDKQDLFLYLLHVANRAMIDFIRQSAPPDPEADFFALLRWQMSATVQASHKFPVYAKLAMRAYSSPLPFRARILDHSRSLRQDYFKKMISRAQSTGRLNPELDPALVNLMVQGVMNDLGPFLQAKFGRQAEEWIDLPEVNEVFDQVMEVLKHGLETKSAQRGSGRA